MKKLLKESSVWNSERARGQGKPFVTFKLSDPTFYGIKGAHVFKSDQHWNWVWWDIAGHERRPSSAVGFPSPERAALHMLTQLAHDSMTIMQRRTKLLEQQS